MQEGLGGRVHEFDEAGILKAYDVEFSEENCATLAGPLKALFEQFSKTVLEGN